MAGRFLWFSLKKPNPQFWSSSSLTVGRIFFAILIQRSGELVLKYATNIYSHTVPSASATRHTSPMRWFSWPVAVTWHWFGGGRRVNIYHGTGIIWRRSIFSGNFWGGAFLVRHFRWTKMVSIPGLIWAGLKLRKKAWHQQTSAIFLPVQSYIREKKSFSPETL